MLIGPAEAPSVAPWSATTESVSAVFALRRVLRWGTAADVRGVRRELVYLDRLARRALRRASTGAA